MNYTENNTHNNNRWWLNWLKLVQMLEIILEIKLENPHLEVIQEVEMHLQDVNNLKKHLMLF